MPTATDPAPVARPAPPRRLWQVPTFLLGAAAFAAAYQGLIPLGPPDPAAAFRADLAALTAAAERLSPDRAELESALGNVGREAANYPEYAPAAHFALGTGYVRLAEITPDPGMARGHWVLARQHFAATDETRVPESDRPKFIFRRAKATAADLPANTGSADVELIRTILSRPPIGEDAGDAPRLVAELSLRVVPPDLARAKDGFTKYLTNTSLGTPAGPLARAKLRLSEVNLALGDPDGAKQWLTAIGADAPTDVLAVAKTHLARIRMTESDWAGAARDWDAARAAPDLPPAVRAASAYHLAECRTRVKADDPDAAKLYDEATKAPGPEAAAAAVRLAGIALKNPDPARRKAAVGHLAAAVRGAKAPADLDGGLLRPVEVQAAFEQAVAVLSADGAYPEAIAAADAYGPVAAGGKDREKKADVYAAWGAALEKAGADGKARYAAAAAEYAALAAARTPDPYQAEQYRRAADFHRKAGNGPAGIAALENAVAVPRLPDEVSGPVWADYADALLAANRPDAALSAFQEAMTKAGPAATASRHKLARNLIDTRDPRKVPLGVELLKQIASAETVAEAERGVHEKALVELGDEAVRAGNYADAETRLRTQLRQYPTGPENGQGRLLLATALLQRIDPRAKAPAADAVKAGEEALAQLKHVLTDVDARKAADRPWPTDPWLGKQANLRVLLAHLLLQKPYDVLTAADPLRREYAGTVEELIVLSMMYHAYKSLNHDNGRLTVAALIREAFDRLKDRPGAFPARSGEYSREYWERAWINPKME